MPYATYQPALLGAAQAGHQLGMPLLCIYAFVLLSLGLTVQSLVVLLALCPHMLSFFNQS